MRVRVSFALLVLLLVGVRLQAAQIDPTATCTTFIQEALRTVGANCGLLDRNSACYGYQSVSANFTEPQPDGFFSAPNARSPLNVLSSIATSPLQTALDQWGISLLSVQANLPETLPGQSVIFMLLGDAEVENAVEPENIYVPGAIITVTTTAASDLLYQPRADADFVASIPANMPLMADAISDDAAYVRVAYQGVSGWVATGALAGGVDLTGLAVITPQTRTSGQAFYLRTSIAETECVEAPNSLVVQGPQNTKVDFSANGAEIRIGSTVVLRAIPLTGAEAENLNLRFLAGTNEAVYGVLELTTLDGEAELSPDTPQSEIVLPGQRIYRCLDQPDNLGLDRDANDNPVIGACPWFDLETLTEDELAEFGALDGVTLNYEIELPLADAVVMPEVLMLDGVTLVTDTPSPTAFAPNTNTPVAFDATVTYTPTFTLTSSNTSTYTPTYTPTFTLTPSNTSTYTPTFTFMPSNTSTYTPTFTVTPSNTSTYTPTFTVTPSNTSTYTPTFTFMPSNTSTYTPTFTVTPSNTSTYTPTFTVTPSNTSTYTPTFTVTPSNTSTYTPTFTVTPSNTSTYTPTFTNTPTFTPTPSCPPNIPPTVVSVAELVCAIEFANSLFGPDTINLAAGGSFTFAIAEGSNTALPTVTDTLTIEGNGATFTRMGGAPSMRYIQSSAPLTIANLTMVGGIAGLSENGGAIFASADLTITDSTFINNLAGSGSGGAIAPQGGMLTIVNSTFTNNSASVRGGAIFADAPTELVRIDGSTFSNGLSAEGGALYTNVPMQINLSSIHSNNATGSGGGVFACTAGTVSIARSALYNNTTSNNGSALYVCAGLGTTVVTNSTFSNNNATVIFNLGTFDLVYSTVYGGTTGISNSNFMRIKNSIIAAADTNCVGAFTFVGTFSDDATCSGALVRTLGELALGTLANNGGSTLTHALGAGSVAINSTDCLDLNSEAVTIDQRGSVRPRPVLTSCDAGAYEDQASFGPMPTLTPTLTNTPLPGIPGCGTMIVNPVTTVAQFRCAIRLANDELYTPGATSFNLQTGATFDFVDANGGVGNVALPDITSDITINGANATLQRNLIIGDLRLFYVPGGHLRLNDMTLRNANVSGDGGALMALGALTLNNVSFNNNNSLNGGAIYINSGVLTVTGGTFSDNSASTGGAIAVRGSTGSTLVGVTLDTNTAQRGGGLFVGNASIAVANSQIINNDALGGASQGGGVYVEDGGSLSIETTLIRNNLAGQSGGAIYSEGDMLLFATTVDANVSNNFGGNIHTCSGTGDQTQITASTISNANDDFGGIGVQTCNNDTTLITNSTISSNGTGVAHTGGASLNIRFSTLADNGTGISSTGSVNLHSALIAGNSNNCFGTIVATGTNVSSDSSCGSGPSMQFVSIGTILLGPLQNNGGTTLTHYLADASAIRNLIIPANCTILGSPLTRDQRGVTRPAGAGCEPGSTENNTAGGGGGADVPFLEGIATETPTPTMTPTASATPTDAPTEVPASNATATLFDPELVPIFTEVPTETPEVTAEAPTEVPTVTTGGSPTPSATLDLSTTAPTMTASATHDGSGETTAEAPTPAPEPTSTLAPVARALNFTAWMVRR